MEDGGGESLELVAAPRIVGGVEGVAEKATAIGEIWAIGVIGVVGETGAETELEEVELEALSPRMAGAGAVVGEELGRGDTNS